MNRILRALTAPLAVCLLLLAFAGIDYATTLGAAPESISSNPIKIAVTVDDIPEHGDEIPGISRQAIARGVLAALKQNDLTRVYGFANGAFMSDNRGEISILKEWLASGYPLGNHTYNHPHLDQLSADAYIVDIAKEDQLLVTLAGMSSLIKERRVFRYPFLEEGNTQSKRDAIRTYLAKNGYRIAEVTVDYDDWAWNDAYTRCLRQHKASSISWLKVHVVDSANRHLFASSEVARHLFGRDISQILLVHVGEFDAIMLSTILARWRQQGVQFVTLDEALKDPVYKINPNLVSEGGRTFLDQIAESRHADMGALLDDTYSPEKLSAVCRDKPSPAAPNSAH